MHVFKFKLPFKLARTDFFDDLLHAALDIGQVFIVQHAALVHHGGVGDGTGDVSERHAFVEINACRVAKHKISHRFGKTARPGFFLLRKGIKMFRSYISHFELLSK